MISLAAPKPDLVNTLLLDIAHQIQLAPADYRRAITAYEALHDHVSRPGSPLNGLVSRFYAQGSVAIGATIASKLKNDEFDIDAIVELSIRHDSPPALVLDELFKAVNGEPGSRYHGKVVRRTRCVTVEYEEMHLDLTPAVLIPGTPARTSMIFHAHEDEPASKHKLVTANPWGFAEWFESRMPAAMIFADAVLRKAAEPVPNQDELNEKALPLVALQLLKRWRNRCYDNRPGRCPPSIVLAYFVAAGFGAPRSDLLSELKYQATLLHNVFRQNDLERTLIEVRNPACNDDVFTDRWPSSLQEQARFTADLHSLLGDLARLASGISLSASADILASLFGESPARLAVATFAERYRAAAQSGSIRHYPGARGVAIGASGLAAVSKPAGATTLSGYHRNFGDTPE